MGSANGKLNAYGRTSTEVLPVKTCHALQMFTLLWHLPCFITACLSTKVMGSGGCARIPTTPSIAKPLINKLRFGARGSKLLVLLFRPLNLPQSYENCKL